MFQKSNAGIKSKTTKSKQRNNIDKQKDFWLWFLWIIKSARIIDTSYSVKGCYVWLDWGFKLYSKIYSLIKEAYEASGHQQMQFPTLIKEEVFQKETDFIRNFENDVFWVDREGQKKLADGERLILRPTSELAIYPMFGKWIRSWRDMPLKLFQNVSIFRCETNETKPLIRNRETIGFIEGHAALRTKKEALAHLEILWKTYSKLFEELGIPFKMIEVPKWDRFAGSEKTIDGYVILPDGKSMELFTSAYLGKTFSKIFDISYLDNAKEKKLAHLLCYGPSIDRILATLIATYGDNQGLKLLPEISPIEIAIIPIFNKKNKQLILTYVIKIENYLKKNNFTTLCDFDEQKTPGHKFYETERLGIPLRIEIGQRETNNQAITLFRRDTLEKESIDFTKSLAKKLKAKLNEMSKTLKSNASQQFNKKTKNISNVTLLHFLQNNTLKQDEMYMIGWCGKLRCSEKIEEATNFNLLGIDFKKKSQKCSCTICNEHGKIAILTKKY